MLHIFTLHWNQKEKLERLFNSMLFVTNNLEFKWYIKDNGSKDGSIEFLQKISKNHKNIHVMYSNNNNDSFSIGMNKLYEIANPEDDDLVLLLNNDLWFVDDKSLKNMIKIIKKDNDVGVVGARILYPGTNRLQHGGVYFSKKYNYLPYHYRYNQISTKTDEEVKEFEAVTGALLLTKSIYFKNACKNKSGRVGFDESLFWAFDDVDYCLSVKYNLGKKVMYCGETFVYHEESASLKKNPVNKMMMPQNVKVFREKWTGKYKTVEG